MRNQAIAKFLLVSVVGAYLSAPAVAESTKVQVVTKRQSFEVVQAPEDKFTGDAHFSRYPVLTSGGDVAPAIVSFEPGARSNWHIHPNGQYLIVVEGQGQTQQWGKPIQTISMGDVVWCPPGVKHWHGATEYSRMRHVVISPVAQEGEGVEWLERVEIEEDDRAKTFSVKELSTRQAAMIPIAAFAASGELDKLEGALHIALNQGLTVNEAREVFIQLYAYAGFPRSLNAINTLISVTKERAAKNLAVRVGEDASPLPENYDANLAGNTIRNKITGRDMTNNTSGYAQFAPIIDVYLKEHLFGDIFSRDLLDFKDRELVTISALAAMEGTNAQLNGHLKVSLNVGLTREQLQEYISVLANFVGDRSAQRAQSLLSSIP